MDLEQHIRDAANDFAQTVVGILRNMTLDELAGIVRQPVASTVAAPARKPRTAKATPANAATKPALTSHLSPKLRAFRKVQGQYAGYLRGFKGAARERIRKINASEGAAAALAEMKKLLAGKAKLTAKTVPAARKTVGAKPVAARTTPKKLKISPARAAQLKLQGTYIGLIRGLPAAQKAAMKKLAGKSGMAAAVKVMQKAKK